MDDSAQTITKISNTRLQQAIASLYRSYLNGIKSKKPESEIAYIPAMAIKSQHLPENFCISLKATLKEAGFFPVDIDTQQLNEEALNLDDKIANSLLAQAKQTKSLKKIARQRRTAQFFKNHSKKLFILLIAVAFITDIVLTDIFDHKALTSMLKRSSIFVVLLMVFLRVLAAPISAAINRSLTKGKDILSVFKDRFIKKINKIAYEQGSPFCIVISNMDILQAKSVAHILKLVQVLQNNGIICIVLGSKNRIAAAIKSDQTKMLKEFHKEIYPFADYGMIEFEKILPVSAYLRISLQSNADTENTYITMPETKTIHDAIHPIIQNCIVPLDLTDHQIIGLTESCKLYASLLDNHSHEFIQTFAAFILADRQDPKWLDTICHKLLYPKQHNENTTDEQASLAESRIGSRKALAKLLIETLTHHKEYLSTCYQIVGREP